MAVAVVAAMGATWVVNRPVGATADPGQGVASAQIIRVNPRAGSLSIGVGLGETNAGHTNAAAKGQSLSLDLGVIGTSLTTASCGSPPSVSASSLPQPLIVENSDPGADKGVTQSSDGVFTEQATATKAPYAISTTSIAAQNIPGVLAVSAGTASTWSGIQDGKRVAGASVDISSLSLLGLVDLGGLHWDASWQSAPTVVHSGHFTVGNIKVGGSLTSLGNPITTLAQLNAVLNAIGIVISPPTVHVTQGIQYVDPLQIALVPNDTRDAILNTIFNAIYPVRQPVFDAILNSICKAATPFEVFDIAVGAISGAGSFDIQLGGVSATSGEVAKNSFDLGLGSNPPPVLSLGSSSSSQLVTTDIPGTLGTPGSAGTPDLTTPPAAQPSAPATQPPLQTLQPITAVKGKRGGMLALVGLIGLAVLAVLAEADRRKMRRAQRAPQFTD